jgi:small subunit ribosomal protein S1
VQGEIEGLVNKSNIFDPAVETLEDALAKHKVGDTIRAVVVEVSAEKQKLALSIRELTRRVQEETMYKYIHDDSTEEKTTFGDLIKDKSKD